MWHKREKEKTQQSHLIQTEGNKKGWGSMSTRSSQHARFISQVLITILLAEWPSMLMMHTIYQHVVLQI